MGTLHFYNMSLEIYCSFLLDTEVYRLFLLTCWIRFKAKVVFYGVGSHGINHHFSPRFSIGVQHILFRSQTPKVWQVFF